MIPHAPFSHLGGPIEVSSDEFLEPEILMDPGRGHGVEDSCYGTSSSGARTEGESEEEKEESGSIISRTILDGRYRVLMR